MADTDIPGYGGMEPAPSPTRRVRPIASPFGALPNPWPDTREASKLAIGVGRRCQPVAARRPPADEGYGACAQVSGRTLPFLSRPRAKSVIDCSTFSRPPKRRTCWPA